MTYKLIFRSHALKEWNKLNFVIREQFRKKLEERLVKPDIIKDKLSDLTDCYKIKLRSSGYRLVYKLIKNQLIIEVIAIGKRDGLEVYKISKNRLT